MDCGSIVGWQQLLHSVAVPIGGGCWAIRVTEVGDGDAIDCNDTSIGWLEVLHRCYDSSLNAIRIYAGPRIEASAASCVGNSLDELLRSVIVKSASGWAIRIDSTTTPDCSDPSCNTRLVYEAMVAPFIINSEGTRSVNIALDGVEYTPVECRSTPSSLERIFGAFHPSGVVYCVTASAP